MAKNKISSQDFLDMLEDDVSQNQKAAFHPSNQPAESFEQSTKTDSKQVANGQQTDSKQAIKTDSKQIANGQQDSSQKPETGSTTGSKKKSNRQQTDSKQVASRIFFESLVGHEKWLLLLVFHECSRTGSLVSPEMTLSYISESLKCSPGTAKSAILRLVEKGFLTRAQSKTGRGGWIRFGLKKDLYQDLRIRETDSKRIANGQQTDSKEVAKQVAQRVASSPSSRDLILNKESTTTHVYSLSILEQIDVELTESLGVTKSVIARAIELYPSLQPEDLQELVYRFSVFSKDPKNKVQSARGFFIGLCKQLSQGIIPLDHIQTPEEKLMEKILKDSKEAAARKQETEDALLTFEFEAWLESVPTEERNELVPESAVVRAGSHAQTVMLKKYYVDNFWSDRRRELLNQATHQSLTV